MSMNIIYEIQGKNRVFYQDFEFQTPTQLTYKILAQETKEEQLKVIYEYMQQTFADDVEYMDILYNRIKENLLDEYTVLGKI